MHCKCNWKCSTQKKRGNTEGFVFDFFGMWLTVTAWIQVLFEKKLMVPWQIQLDKKNRIKEILNPCFDFFLWKNPAQMWVFHLSSCRHIKSHMINYRKATLWHHYFECKPDVAIINKNNRGLSKQDWHQQQQWSKCSFCYSVILGSCFLNFTIDYGIIARNNTSLERKGRVSKYFYYYSYLQEIFFK